MTERGKFVALLLLVGFIFIIAVGRNDDGGRLREDAQPAKNEAAKTKRSLDETALLTINNKGPQGNKPLEATSPFFSSHKLTLRTLKRSEPDMEWLPAEEVKVGCVPCYNALTFIAVIDGEPYAFNGATLDRASRMTVTMPGAAAKRVKDPDGPDGVLTPSDAGTNSTERDERLDRLKGEIEKVTGCEIGGGVQGSLQRTFDAIRHGVCLPSGD